MFAALCCLVKELKSKKSFVNAGSLGTRPWDATGPLGKGRSRVFDGKPPQDYKVVPQVVNAKLVQISPIVLWLIRDLYLYLLLILWFKIQLITGGAPPCRANV